MEVQKALEQISEIHRHLAKTEVCRAIRSVPVGLTGVVAIVGAVLMPHVIGDPEPIRFVFYWIALSLLNVALVMTEVSVEYLAAVPSDRRLIRRVIGQFFPALAAGVVMTAVFTNMSGEIILHLPGVWALMISVGLFSARPYLPRTVGWVALFYGAAGAVLLFKAPATVSLANYSMGTVFGSGQLLTSLVFYWNLERGSDV